jgi:hypothetical protein
MQIAGGKVLPFDYAISIIEIIFVFIEIIYCVISSANITRKTANSFYLRNTSTSNYIKDDSVKSSNEIEQELFFHFPNLSNFKNTKSCYNNNPNNYNDNNNNKLRNSKNN